MFAISVRGRRYSSALASARSARWTRPDYGDTRTGDFPMSGGGPTVEVHLPNRAKVPLGTSLPLLALDWLTQTWFRFNALVCWLVLVFILIGADVPFEKKILTFIVSPVAAPILYVMWSLSILTLSFIPIVKVPLGVLRLTYLRLFSRLIVQRVRVEMPVWF